jgi:hypothetical protein
VATARIAVSNLATGSALSTIASAPAARAARTSAGPQYAE